MPLALLVAAVLAWSRLPAQRGVLFLGMALLFAAAFRLSVHAGREGALPGQEFQTYRGEDVLYDAPRVTSVREFLRDYSTLQPNLSLHGRHFPPGFALMSYAIIGCVGRDLTRIGSVLALLASLIVLPAYFLGKALRGSVEDGRACAMLAATLPASVLFGAVSFDAVYAALAAAAFLAILSELRAPHCGWRLALGLLLFLGMMLSYSTFLVGLFCALVLVLDRFRRPAACLAHLAQVLGAFLVPFAALYFLTGFDALLCFTNARQLNEAMMSEIVGRPLASPGVWAYLSLGNLLAFLIGLGPAVLSGWLLLAARRPARAEAIVLAAFGATLLAACFCGLYQMETERIFLYLATPGLLLASLSPAFRPRAAALAAGVQAIVMEMLLYTLW